MTADFLAWSHSRRNTYLECPKKLWHTAVAKKGHPERIEFSQSAAMIAGNLIDDALTKRISGNVPLPSQFAPYEPMAAAVLAAPGTKMTQVKLALDQAFQPCGFMDWDRAWLRVIYDVAVLNGEHGWLGDWKNGQIWLESDQLKIFAAAGFHHFPELQVIDSSYVWLAHGQTSDATYRRKDLPELWGELLPAVENMQVSYKTNHWPPTPSKRACKFCEVRKRGMCPVGAAFWKSVS